MACCGGGHHEDRFQTAVDKNFFCPICQEVLKDPVQCHNEHYFCKACITQHLKNSQTCPVCMERVTEETLYKPSRIVTNYLDGLMINCDHSERGCTEVLELVRLEAHVSVCEYRPVTCPNEKCAKIMNLADFEEHTSEVCEYRQVYCDECDEDMSAKKYGKHGCVISKDVHAVKASLIQLQNQVKEMSKAQKKASETQKKASETLKEVSETQKEILVATKDLRTTASGISTTEVKPSPTLRARPQGSIVVVGGRTGSTGLSSVEMYSLANRTWRNLPPMKQARESSTAHFYNGQVMVTGGECDRGIFTDSIEYIQVHVFTIFSEARCLGVKEFFTGMTKLAMQSCGHKTVILNDVLWMVGGYCYPGKYPATCSDLIYGTNVHSNLPCIVNCRMPRPISYHGLEIVHGDELLIIGGSTTGGCGDAVDTVLLYDTLTNSLRQMHPLPSPLCDMATVKHGEDVIIIGGTNKDGEYLHTVSKYNCKENEWEQLPRMQHRRSECAAVISGNKVIVMGGYNEEQGYLSSVECFDLDHQVWYELPSMSEAKHKIAAVLVP